jgi:hypothetical protein
LGQKNQKSSHGGSVLGRGDPIGAGYAGVEVVRGHALRLSTVAPPLTSSDPRPTYLPFVPPPAPGSCSLVLVRHRMLSVCAYSRSVDLACTRFASVRPCLHSFVDVAAAAAVAVAELQLRILLPPSPSRIRAPSLSLALWFVCACPACASLMFVTPYCKRIISILTIILAYLCI